jgi:hypothetical protein
VQSTEIAAALAFVVARVRLSTRVVAQRRHRIDSGVTVWRVDLGDALNQRIDEVK